MEVERITETGEKSFFAEIKDRFGGQLIFRYGRGIPQFRQEDFKDPMPIYLLCVGSDRSSFCVVIVGEIDPGRSGRRKKIKSFF